MSFNSYPTANGTFTASLARRETRTKASILHDPNKQNIDHGGQAIGLSDLQYQAILEGMNRVVGPNGTARRAQVDGLDIAGKTGTAQIKSHGKRLTLAWFVGFAPIQNPQIAVVVLVEGKQRSDNYAGGKTAGPIAKAVFEAFAKQNQHLAGSRR